MAHAAPAPGRPGRTSRTATRTPYTTPSRTPDVFSARTHRIAQWAVPVTLGLIYGYWVAANNRSGGEITGWNLLLGFVSALAFMALWVALWAVAPRMKRELHALLWAAFAGSAFGFMYSQAGNPPLRSTGMALAAAATVFAILFYRYYTHEDAAGRRIR
ncbi:hypothetical protein RKD23_003691 [Streptomyces sp. SAI-170]|uniref:hypothetical protein n=1 Tax=Streptomyces sp. SAI-170 TaxID=3377729 RepID=UPI003C7BF3D5